MVLSDAQRLSDHPVHTGHNNVLDYIQLLLVKNEIPPNTEVTWVTVYNVRTLHFLQSSVANTAEVNYRLMAVGTSHAACHFINCISDGLRGVLIKMKQHLQIQSKRSCSQLLCGQPYVATWSVPRCSPQYTVLPPYPLIQHPLFELSAVHRGPKKKMEN
jgi:hypothetical protein